MTPATTKAFRGVSLEMADRFVGYITDRCDSDKGASSALRRGLRRTPDQATTMHRYVARWTESLGEDEWAHYTVAALIASRPRKTRNFASTDNGQEDEAHSQAEEDPAASKPRRPNLGATLAKLSGSSDRLDTVERRLHLLVRQGVPGMQRHLPGVIRLLASAQVSPDWGVLLRDLSRWRKDRDRIARSWLQDYYRARFREESAADPGTQSANDLSGE